MASADDARNQIVLVAAHPRERHVGGGPAPRHVQPKGYMLQSHALHLRHRARIPKPDGVAGHPAAIVQLVRHQMDGQTFPGAGGDFHAAALRVERLDRGGHAVDEVVLFGKATRASVL